MRASARANESGQRIGEILLKQRGRKLHYRAFRSGQMLAQLLSLLYYTIYAGVVLRTDSLVT